MIYLDRLSLNEDMKEGLHPCKASIAYISKGNRYVITTLTYYRSPSITSDSYYLDLVARVCDSLFALDVKIDYTPKAFTGEELPPEKGFVPYDD